MKKKLLCCHFLLVCCYAVVFAAGGADTITLTRIDSTTHNVLVSGKPDTLQLILTFHNTRTGLPPADLHLTLTGMTGATQTQPRLLDSIPFPAGVRVKQGDVTRKVRIVLMPLKCLAADETFVIGIAGQGRPITLTVKSREASGPPKTASVSLVQDTSYLIPVIKGGSAPTLQVMTSTLVLSGPAGDEAKVKFLIPKFMANTPSHPTLFKYDTFSIPKDTLMKNGGCPVRFPVQLMVQLTPVDTPSGQQLFYLQLDGKQDAVAVVIIPATGTMAAKTPAAAPKSADSPYRFSFTCSGHQYTIQLNADTTAIERTIRVTRDNTKTIITYQYVNVLDAADLATFLYNNLKPLMTQDCANYVSFRVANELRTINSIMASAPTTAPPPATTTAPNPSPAAFSPTPVPASTPSANTASPQTANSKTSATASISLDNGTTIIHPYYTNKDTTEALPIDFFVVRDTLPASLPDTEKINLVLDKYTFPSPKDGKKPFALISDQTISQFPIPKKSWFEDTATKKYKAPIHLFLVNTPIDSIHSTDRLANIRIAGGDNTYHVLRLTEDGMVNFSYPFWVDLGTNFDLLDGVKLNNLYGGVYGFVKDVAKIGRGATKNLSITGGVYEARSISTGSSSDSGLIYRDGTSFNYDSSHGGFPYYRDTGTVKSNLSVTSIGIFFSPHLRVTNGPADGYGLHLFVSLYLELLWQKVTNTFDYSATGRSNTMYNASIAGLNDLQYKENSKSADYRSQYIGAGIPFLLKTKIFSMYVNSVFGWANQKFVAVSDTSWENTGAYKIPPKYQLNWIVNANGFQQPACRWNAFILEQFRLEEEKYGISFTGEVRSILLRDAKPVISISLSKKFDLSQLFNTIVRPFTPGVAQ